VFTRKMEFPVKDWEALHPYSVGFIIGWKILEKNIKSTKYTIKAKEPRQLFNLLGKKRVDLVVYDRWMGLFYIKKNNLSFIKTLEPPLVQKQMYLYLHKKHLKLVPEIASSLRQMKEDGTYEKIFNKVLKPFTEN